mmetsp:Transcript_45783/g.127026  ORF Transcript_45783/g.127026 Transcript_45783/m.127026 type:complete len:354 (+) Transcript_45783:576-1637(+)
MRHETLERVLGALGRQDFGRYSYFPVNVDVRVLDGLGAPPQRIRRRPFEVHVRADVPRVLPLGDPCWACRGDAREIPPVACAFRLGPEIALRRQHFPFRSFDGLVVARHPFDLSVLGRKLRRRRFWPRALGVPVCRGPRGGHELPRGLDRRRRLRLRGLDVCLRLQLDPRIGLEDHAAALWVHLQPLHDGLHVWFLHLRPPRARYLAWPRARRRHRPRRGCSGHGHGLHWERRHAHASVRRFPCFRNVRGFLLPGGGRLEEPGGSRRGPRGCLQHLPHPSERRRRRPLAHPHQVASLLRHLRGIACRCLSRCAALRLAAGREGLQQCQRHSFLSGVATLSARRRREPSWRPMV